MPGRPSLQLAAGVLPRALAGCSGEGLTLGEPSDLAGQRAGEHGVACRPARPPTRRASTPSASSRPAAVGRREVIANPSLAEVMQPGELPEMALGRADAPVTIVQYASMTCPYCRQFQRETFPVLKREYIDTGKVRYILREFPIGKQSGLATIALRCAPADKYFVLYDKLMAQQASWVSQEVRPDPIFKVAAQVGMTRAQFDSCRENRGMIDALNGSRNAGARSA